MYSPKSAVCVPFCGVPSGLSFSRGVPRPTGDTAKAGPLEVLPLLAVSGLIGPGPEEDGPVAFLLLPLVPTTGATVGGPEVLGPVPALTGAIEEGAAVLPDG